VAVSAAISILGSNLFKVKQKELQAKVVFALTNSYRKLYY
jgi:hypothetical protein